MEGTNKQCVQNNLALETLVFSFFKGDTLMKLVDNDGKLLLSLDQLLKAISATLKITNQKNGCMRETIHHECMGKDTSPVKHGLPNS